VNACTLLQREMEMQIRYSPIPTYVLRRDVRLRMHDQEVFRSDNKTSCTPMNESPKVLRWLTERGSVSRQASITYHCIAVVSAKEQVDSLPFR
jgi:hypothetical protein